VPPPQPPDVALLRRVLDGLKRLQADPPADLAVHQPRAPWTEPHPAAGDLPPLETRVPGPSPASMPPEAEHAGQTGHAEPQGPVDGVPPPPMPTRRSSLPGASSFLGSVGMTMPAADEPAPPYSVDKTHSVSIS
jgi:hypothetical protein